MRFCTIIALSTLLRHGTRTRWHKLNNELKKGSSNQFPVGFTKWVLKNYLVVVQESTVFFSKVIVYFLFNQSFKLKIELTDRSLTGFLYRIALLAGRLSNNGVTSGSFGQ